LRGPQALISKKEGRKREEKRKRGIVSSYIVSFIL
jgi:uncharacterized protein Veg